MTETIKISFPNGDMIKYDVVFDHTSYTGHIIGVRNPKPLDQCGFWGHDLHAGLAVEEGHSSRALCRECKNVIEDGMVVDE